MPGDAPDHPPAPEGVVAERLLTPRFVLVVTAGLAYFMSLGVLLPVVPQFVERRLGGDSLAVGIAVGAFSVGAVLLRPVAGRLGDRVGRRLLIIGGAALVSVSAALHGVVPGVPTLVAVRVLGGIGEAAFFVGAGTMVTDLAPEARRGEAISYWSVAVYGGLAFGPLLGELVLGDAGGRTAPRGHFGTVWVLSAALAATAAVLALGTRETLSPERRAAAAHHPAPLIHRRAVAPGMVLFLGMMAFAGFATFVPLYVDDIGVGDSSGAFLLYGVVVLAVRLAGARVPDRIGALASGTIATSTIAAGMVLVGLVGSPVGLYLGTGVFALGMAFLYPAMLMLGLTGVPEHERGSAVGTVSTFFDLSQGVGAAVLGGVVAVVGNDRGAFLAGAILSVGALVLLRSGADPRTRQPVDHAAFEEARQHVEPEPP